MPRISKDFIVNRLIPAVKIDAFLSTYLTLKRSGNGLMCCCPFHNEKTPSFYVTPSRGTYHCFGCGAHGNAINFLINYKNLTFIEAVEELAEYAGLEVEYEAGGAFYDQDRYARFYDLMDRCAAYYIKHLSQSKIAQDYWYQKRQLTRDIVLKARLGYAPDAWDDLRVNVARNEEEVKALIELGMINQRDNGTTFSMFRNRVMIPIVNLKGKVISFGGRCLGDEKPKYLNTKETPIFKKRNELFGLYECLQETKNRPSQLVIVEGYMDVIALRQAGIGYAVASLGTSTTADHFKLMFRYTKKVFCCYDGDAAGQNAAWRALENLAQILEADKEVRFAFLPQEHDPDSLVREQGAGGFTRFLDEALSFPDFLVNHLAQNYDLADGGDRARFLSAVLPIIKDVNSLPLRNVCAETLAKKLAMDITRINEMLDATQAKSEAFESATVQEKERSFQLESARLLNTPMRRLIAFLLQQPTVVGLMYDKLQLENLIELLKDLGAKGVEELKFILNLVKNHQDIISAQIIEEVRDTKYEKIFNLLINASFIPRKENGDELSIEDRAEYLSKIIAECIFSALQYQKELLALKGNSITREEFDAAQQITKLLAQRFDFKA